MSSRYVRQKVRDWLGIIGVPFYDTNFIEQNPVEDIWCTVDWESATKQKMSYCGDFNEVGSFSVQFLGKGGVGDDDVLAVAEPAMEVFMANTDSKLQLMSYDPAEDFRTGDDAPLYGASFRVEYELTGA